MDITKDSNNTSQLQEKPNSPPRRSFLGALLVIAGGAVSVLLAAPLMRFALYPIRAKTTETSWSDLGSVSDFDSFPAPVRKTVQVERRDGWRKMTSEQSVYVTRDVNRQLRVLSSVCPHLGCMVPWLGEKNEFICPCHGAIFGPDGTYRGGPAPRGMDWLETKVDGGHLFVRYEYFRQLVPTREVIG